MHSRPRPDHPVVRTLAGALLCVSMIGVGTVAAEPPLDDESASPDEELGRLVRDAICAGDPRPSVCCPGDTDASTDLVRLRRGSFTKPETDELVAHVRGCNAAGTALLRTRADDPPNLVSFYPNIRSQTCHSVRPTDGPDLLVCHRRLEDDTWRVGFFYTLDFREGAVERRQLATYENNARGCPTDSVKTTEPVGWRVWQPEGDPRSPLLTIHFQDRDGPVPDEYADACEAMEDGRFVFGSLHRRTEYYALRERHFRYVGARSMTGESGEPAWVDDRRPEEEICRREDALQRVRQSRPKLTQCYARALQTDRSLAGTLRVRWSVDHRGRVASTDVVEDNLGSARLRKCVRNVVASFEFPRPRGADSCRFVHTFEFAAPERSDTEPELEDQTSGSESD